jgi:tRNA-specific 2-thiouridylase
MSGGVDSSVAAALLVERGYDVTGIMLKLWKGEAENNRSGCCNLGAADDARRVADVLGIPFYVLNFAERFEDSVIRNFEEDYAAGRTPNPCVRCNQWIKFDALLERADALGAEYLATGHYARVAWDGERHRLLRGVDPQKDQSYVLWMLTQRQLSRCLFPVGEMEKPQTRRLAGELGLRTATKADSQEICFVRDGDLGSYISDRVPAASVPGPILDPEGTVLGSHRGIGNYTVGQRRGLGISLGAPVFVSSIDAERNSITVGAREDLLVTGFSCDEVGWTGAPPSDGALVLVQHRAHGEVNEGRVVEIGDGTCRVELLERVESVAPGQSAAFYSAATPEELLGGGVVTGTRQATAVA